MSTTVSDLIEEIQDAIPAAKLPSLFPAINRALKTIAKRLYVHESDLMLADMSVSLFASVDYTAATIAFVSGGLEASDTITDTALQFVTEGFTAGMPIETDSTGNEGPARISTAVAGTITLDARETVITAAAAGSSVTITSVADFGYMPDDFWGMVDSPYIDGYTWKLLPLPNVEAKLAYSSAGLPKFYKLKDNRLYVIPATSADITIKGDYWKKPVKLINMDNYIPWNEIFDDVIEEYVARVLIQGIAVTDTTLRDYLFEAVDLVVAKRDKKAAVSMPGGIHWGF